LLQGHALITAAQRDLESAQRSARVALGDYLPSVDLTAAGGREKTASVANNPPVTYSMRDNSITFKQLIWDFGKTTADIRAADAGADKAEAALKSVQQGVTLQAVAAYWNLLRGLQIRDLALESSESVKKQLDLEEQKVKKGAGIASDVLQAKTALNSSYATYERAHGLLVNAANGFQAAFRDSGKNSVRFVTNPVGVRSANDVKVEVNGIAKPKLPDASLPKTLDEAIKGAMENNLALAASRFALVSTKEKMRSDEAKLYGPSINYSYKYSDKFNASAVAGFKTETLSKVELTYPLFAGFKHKEASEGSKANFLAQSERYTDEQIGIENLVRDSWQNVMTQQANAGYLQSQAESAKSFLELARKERQLGKRSLLDILNGEVAYINASSAAESASIDAVLAKYALLAAMGKLDLVAVLGESARPKQPTEDSRQ
jgi:adhesin transport system outer membrane protein